MAFNHRHLDNILGSTGKHNLWLYYATDIVPGETLLPGYFNNAIKYGIKECDIMGIYSTVDDQGRWRVIHIQPDGTVYLSPIDIP